MKQILLLFFGGIMTPVITFGQSGYFATDSSMVVIVNVVDGGEVLNSRILQVKEGETIVQYTPYEVMEYGFNDGRVYLSKEVQLFDSRQRVFLERLEKGNATLYYYRGRNIKTFFIEKDSTLFTELPKYNRENGGISFNDMLLKLTSDCHNVSDAAKLVRYKKRSLSKFISRYNRCDLSPFPFTKYGFIMGIRETRLFSPSGISNQVLENSNFKLDKSFSIGVFIDQPILVSNFSLYMGLTYSENSYSSSVKFNNKDSDVVANLSSIEAPVLVRYTLPSLNFRPFVNLGVTYSYNMRNDNYIYEAAIDDNVVNININNRNKVISDHQLGYGLGIGTQYHLKYNKIVFAEIRFNVHYSLTSEDMLNRSGFELVTGINL